MRPIVEKYFKIIFALYQIIGGVFGLYMLFIHGLSMLPEYFLVFILIFLLFLFSLFCGFRLLLDKPNGYRLTFINQNLQIVKIKVLGFGYEYFMGIPAMIGFTDTPKFKFFFDFKLIFSSKAYLYFNDNYEVSLILNIIPIILIIVMIKYKLTGTNKGSNPIGG